MHLVALFVFIVKVPSPKPFLTKGEERKLSTKA